MTARIVLASGSATRRQLLINSGVPVTAAAAGVDEENVRLSLTAERVSPRDQADALAELKAEKLARRHHGAWVIGCDQVLELDGQVFSKPADEAELVAQLSMLSGRTHTLFSAAVVFESDRPVWRHVGAARLTMHELSRDFTHRYVERNWSEVRHSVGGYQIEAEGIRLFSRIEGDYHSILGLPLVELLSYLTLRKVIEI